MSVDIFSAVREGSADLPCFYGGEWQAGSGERMTVIEPATSHPLATVPSVGASELELAVQVAKKAQKEWAATPMTARQKALQALADRVEAHADELALLDTRDIGSPFTAMQSDAVRGAGALRYSAGLALELKGDTIPLGQGSMHYTTLEPWGVVARLIAFNHPTLFVCGRMAPALITGNAVVIKPSDLAPLSALAIAQLAEDLFPPGLLSVLTGGPDLGKAIVANPDIRRLSFTGSVPTALQIAAGAAASGVLKTITYELGGKNPIIVLADADLDQAAEAVVNGMNFTRVQGQSCGSTSRLFVESSIAEKLVSRVVARVEKIKIGDPTDRSVEMGCLITKGAQERVLGMIQSSVEDGAKLVTGGARPDDPALGDGAFVAPTVLTDVPIDSELAQTEVFGPVLSVHPFESLDEAIEQANSVRYGLTASVWTNDLTLAMQVVEQFEAGYVWVNDVERRYPAVPFGGWKDSGSGLEHGIEELISFTRTRAVNIRFDQP